MTQPETLFPHDPSLENLSVLESAVQFLALEHNNNELASLDSEMTGKTASCRSGEASLESIVLPFSEEFIGVFPLKLQAFAIAVCCDARVAPTGHDFSEEGILHSITTQYRNIDGG